LIRSLLPLSGLAHPLIERAAADTAGGPAAPSENRIIRCVREQTGEAWLEIKKPGTEWRGAVAYDTEGVPWLVFATSHGHDAFYSELERGVRKNGAEFYMPTEYDYGYLELERSFLVGRSWRIANVARAVDCVASAVQAGGKAQCSLEGHPKGPAGPVAELHVEIERHSEPGPSLESAHEEDVLIQVFLTFTRPVNRKHEQLLVDHLGMLLNPQSGQWDPWVKPNGVTTYVGMINEARLLQLYAASVASGSGQISTLAVNPPPPTHAHYTLKLPLAAAIVDGKPVRAVCGLWFVPLHDHEKLPVCPRCEADFPVVKMIDRLLGQVRTGD
jgi:hypothetical protein